MKIILSTAIIRTTDGLHTFFHKEIETGIIPIPGMGVEDTAWKEPKIPVNITCNFDEGYYFLTFEDIRLDTKENCEQETRMYVLHGWKRLIQS